MNATKSYLCGEKAYITKYLCWCHRWANVQTLRQFHLAWTIVGIGHVMHVRRLWCCWVSSSHFRLFKDWSSSVCVCVCTPPSHRPARCLLPVFPCFHFALPPWLFLCSGARHGAGGRYVNWAHVLFLWRSHAYTRARRKDLRTHLHWDGYAIRHVLHYTQCSCLDFGAALLSWSINEQVTVVDVECTTSPDRFIHKAHLHSGWCLHWAVWFSHS